MPSSTRLLEDFILPALDTAAFGHFLEWVDPNQKKSFKVFYHHKNGRNWSKDSADVFVAWDRLKGRIPDSEDYFTKSRQRFRVALAKCPRLEKVPASGDKHVQIFNIVSHKKRNTKPDSCNSSQSSITGNNPEHSYKSEGTSEPNTAVICPTANPETQSDKTILKSAQTSVIVSLEEARRKRKAFLEVALNSQTESHVQSPKETKEKELNLCTLPESSEQAKEFKSATNVIQYSMPPKIVHRMPVVPVPERTSRIEVLKSKPKTICLPLHRVINCYKYPPEMPLPVDDNKNLNVRSESKPFVNAGNNLSLLNIQRIQKLL